MSINTTKLIRAMGPSLLNTYWPFLPSRVHQLQILKVFVKYKNVKLSVILVASPRRSS